MSNPSETTTGAQAGASITAVACPACTTLVPVVCGDVTGLHLDEMIAVALAKADHHHELGGQAGDHLPVHVSLTDPTPPPRYLRQAADMMFPSRRINVADGFAPLRPDTPIPIRRRPPDEIRRRLRESNLPSWLVTGLLDELGIAETATTWPE